MDSTVLFHRHDRAIAVLTLNRPDKRNALTIELMDALQAEIGRLEADADCRVVILCGAGPMFCAGLDLIEAAESKVAERSAQSVAKTFQALVSSPLISIASVQGGALAGGAGLMASCDFAVATTDAKFGFPEVRRGLVPALVSAVLRSRLRDSEMRQLFLLGEAIDAQSALQLGLVQRVVPERKLMEEVHWIAQTVCKGGPDAIRQTKELIRQVCGSNLNAIADTLSAHWKARTGEEAKEGLAAFRERRQPNWMR
ncbi:MAG: enoyl-CoA hydratase/isomerase family protein [Pirellulaceae bacterium]|nr:enoyl-CoA hydratase/isomerase family protein [Pirellulaceae bacterium]